MVDKRLEDIFIIHLPGGRVARLPAEVVDRFIISAEDASRIAHPPNDDVLAHSASIDASTGASAWHTEWEYGPCDYTDEAGNLQSAYAWHRHPLGTEYTELYQK